MEKTKMRLDPWLPTTPPRPSLLTQTADPNQLFNDIIDEHTHQWNAQWMLQNIYPSDHPLINKIFLPPHPKRDSIIWSHTTNDNYTIKFGYWLASILSLSEDEPRPSLFNHTYISTNMWRQWISPKTKHFLWRLSSKAIGVKDNLIHRNVRVNSFCSRCCFDIETSDHVFLHVHILQRSEDQRESHAIYW